MKILGASGLTDIDGLHAFEISMKECRKTTIEFFKNKSKDEKVNNVLSQAEDTGMALLYLHIKLIMPHFQKHENILVLHADVSISLN